MRNRIHSLLTASAALLAFLGGVITIQAATLTVNVTAGNIQTQTTVPGGTTKIVKTGTGTLNLNLSYPLTEVEVDAGTINLNNSFTSHNALLHVVGGRMYINANQSISTLTIDSGSAILAYNYGSANYIDMDTLNLSANAGAELDVNNNFLIIRSGSLSTITGLIASGLDVPNDYLAPWKGPGINSSAAATDPNGLRWLGVADRFDLGIATFHGVSVGSHWILVDFVWVGDTNLDGDVDPGASTTDYDNFHLGYTGVKSASWLYGDFDYNGIVTADDYSIYLAGKFHP